MGVWPLVRCEWSVLFLVPWHPLWSPRAVIHTVQPPSLAHADTSTLLNSHIPHPLQFKPTNTQGLSMVISFFKVEIPHDFNSVVITVELLNCYYHNRPVLVSSAAFWTLYFKTFWCQSACWPPLEGQALPQNTDLTIKQNLYCQKSLQYSWSCREKATLRSREAPQPLIVWPCCSLSRTPCLNILAGRHNCTSFGQVTRVHQEEDLKLA